MVRGVVVLGDTGENLPAFLRGRIVEVEIKRVRFANDGEFQSLKGRDQSLPFDILLGVMRRGGSLPE